uniref:Cytosolic fatty-acid binding proteins domain-containing protein n=1 Tax=Callorhinchus milii TaxID=7868 RepID=A0A4W3I9L4_CALMI
MAFTGQYELESQENFEPFMRAIGECLDIEQTKAIGWVTDIIQKGDHFKMMTRLNNRQHVNEFTLGKEANIETYTGQMFKRCIVVLRLRPGELIDLKQICTKVDGEVGINNTNNK